MVIALKKKNIKNLFSEIVYIFKKKKNNIEIENTHLNRKKYLINNNYFLVVDCDARM